MVSTGKAYDWTETEWRLGTGFAHQSAPKYHVVAYDYGVKANILRMLAERGCKVTVRSDPPTRTLAPTPTPAVASAVAPA